jgi:hypothetical protein
LLSVFAAKRELCKQGVNWVIYTVCVVVVPGEVGEEGKEPSGLFRFSVAEFPRFLASGEVEVGVGMCPAKCP